MIKYLLHKTTLISLSLIATLVSSCVKEIDGYQPDPLSSTTINEINEMVVPANFRYGLDTDYDVTITLKCNDDSPIEGVVLRFYDDTTTTPGSEIYTGVSDQNGVFHSVIPVKSSLSSIILKPDYIGLMNDVSIDLTAGTTINITLGGSSPQRIKSSQNTVSEILSSVFKTSAVPTKSYLGTWNSQGVPNYLTTTRDVISAAFLERVNYSLPEYRPVPQYNPQYIANGTESNALITQRADVWMTFVHEGAGHLNTIGYYVYNKNNPPTSTSNLNVIKIVFPNFSYKNSGGGLVSGDKVYLGQFGPDTVIGFVCLANAYNSSNNTVGNGNGQFYSNPDLNPEPNANQRPHNVALWDQPSQKLVIGFEDLNRTGGDNDFNDAVFFMTSNPIAAISTTNIINTRVSNDTDSDGITDNLDEYPTDPDLAFNSYYPSSTTFANIGFEDLWPYKGDYDMNDLIVGYRMNLVKNSSNEVKQIQTKVFVKAIGGSYQNGFGWELPVSPSEISAVTGTSLSGNYIATNANGTEANQNKAVIIAFDNALNLAPRPTGFYVNTQPTSPVVVSDTLRLSIYFTNAQPMSVLGTAPFNPFMISNLRRGYEIHLPDKAPTSLADQSIFNTGNDRSNAALGRYYRSDRNLPWAINVPDNYPIVIEKTQIIQAYLKFENWCQTGGTTYNDWYDNKSGYRDDTKLLNR